MKLIRYLVVPVLLLLTSVSHAWLWEQAPDKTVQVTYNLSVAAATNSTSTLVIDLSDTTNWPHKDTGEINISSIRVDIDKVAASTVTVKLGVVNFVDTSTGSVTWFYSRGFAKNVSNTDVLDFQSYGRLFRRLRANSEGRVTNGSTPYLLSNDTTDGSTTYQIDVALPSPNGNTKPGRGDIVMQVTKDGSNIAVLNIEILYHSGG